EAAREVGDEGERVGRQHPGRVGDRSAVDRQQIAHRTLPGLADASPVRAMRRVPARSTASGLAYVTVTRASIRGVYDDPPAAASGRDRAAPGVRSPGLGD